MPATGQTAEDCQQQLDATKAVMFANPCQNLPDVPSRGCMQGRLVTEPMTNLQKNQPAGQMLHPLAAVGPRRRLSGCPSQSAPSQTAGRAAPHLHQQVNRSAAGGLSLLLYIQLLCSYLPPMPFTRSKSVVIRMTSIVQLYRVGHQLKVAKGTFF